MPRFGGLLLMHPAVSAHLPGCSLQGYIWLRLQIVCVCRELLYQGDRDTILEVLSWIFEQDQQQDQVLQKRAHIGFYLSGLEVGAANTEAQKTNCCSRLMPGWGCICIATPSAASMLSSLVYALQHLLRPTNQAEHICCSQ